MSETIVQKKLAKLIQQELSGILTFERSYVPGAMLTISIVRVTGDLGIAKVYMSVFPDDKLETSIDTLNEQQWDIRTLLARRIKNKVRKIPEIRFFKDDSFQEANKIDQLLKGIDPNLEE